MQTVKFVYWEEDGAWIGYLQDYPDYWTQGEMLDDLREHLRDIYNDVTNGELTGICKFDELVHRQPDNMRLERHAMWPFPGIASVIATGRRGFW